MLLLALFHPVPERALVHAERPGDLSDRPAGLQHDADRTVFEVRIELPSFLGPGISS